jgi:hypothetical protein
VNNQISKAQKRIGDRLDQKSGRRRAIRYSLLALNVILLGVVIVFIVRPHSKALVVNSTSSVVNAASTSTNPLDQLSSADIALTVSRVTSLPESSAVKNQAESVNAELAVAPSVSDVSSKPQVVNTAFKSREDIQSYTACLVTACLQSPPSLT